MNIILFDGICNLCESSVRFIIKHDKKAYFHFVSQQSSRGKALLKMYDLETVETIVLLSKNRAYIYSDCLLEVAKHLDGIWRFLYLFRFVPKVVRDWVYQQIAKYRYNFFGRNKHCILPTLEIRNRFLD